MRWPIFLLLIFSVGFSAQTVYKTPSGSKYHLSNCRMVKNVSAAVSVSHAQQQGLSPCKICRPSFTPGLGIMSTSKKPAGINSGNRCPAITKAGTRCKRNTRIGNNFCFQHLPKSKNHLNISTGFLFCLFPFVLFLIQTAFSPLLQEHSYS